MSRRADRVDGTDCDIRRVVFWTVLAVAVVLMTYGFYSANPFETYHNASSL